MVPLNFKIPRRLKRELQAYAKHNGLSVTAAVRVLLPKALRASRRADQPRTSKETPMTLPAWAELSDVDKGNVLLHLHKRDYEGGEYAEEHYPAKFSDHPTLVGLEPLEACRFAKSMRSDADDLHYEEYGRLYDLALEVEEATR